MAQHESFLKVSGIPQNGTIRKFETGATRDQDATKPDYEGFISPLVITRFGEYMNKNRVQPDGSTRDSDNWQKGIPLDAYMKSGWRHFLDWWLSHRGQTAREDVETALCGLLFNVMGYLHEYLKKKDAEARAKDERRRVRADAVREAYLKKEKEDEGVCRFI